MEPLLLFLLFTAGWGSVGEGDFLDFSLEYGKGDVSLIREGDFTEVSVKGGFPEFWPGKPELPACGYLAVIPRDKDVDYIEILEIKEKLIAENVIVKPSQNLEIPGEPKPEPVFPDPKVYSQKIPFPKTPIQLASVGGLAGYKVAGIKVYPVRYLPAEKKLFIIEKLRFRIYLKPGSEPVYPIRQSAGTFDRWRKFLQGLVLNPSDVDRFAPPTQVVKVFDKFSPTLFPSTELSPVDLVIITTDELENEFKEYAEWKLKQGIPTVVRTVSWIERNYPGSDVAEKIRNFLKECYQKWGTQWVLLGGDSPDIPLRVVFVNIPTGPTIHKFIPTDLYYACLDGSWNADGDTIFGEDVVDSTDYFPELLVGRVPVSNSSEFEVFFNKMITYTQSPDTAYIEKALFVGTEMDFYPCDGATLCDSVADNFPPYFQINKMYECERNHDVQEFIDSLYSGQHYVFSESHGNVGWFYVNFFPREPFMNSYADSLTNTTKLGFFHLIACMIGAVDKNCISEHLFRSPGGAIAVLSTTRYNFPFSALTINEALYDSIFYASEGAEPLSWCDLMSRTLFLPSVGIDAVKRYIYVSYLLLADPTLVLWRRVPDRVSIEIPEIIGIGNNWFRVRVKNAATEEPMEGISVCVYKKNEVFAAGTTDASGIVCFEINPTTPGYLYVTASGGDVFLQIDSAWVTNNTSFVDLVEVKVSDNKGDNDRRPEAGEEINLGPVFCNVWDNVIPQVWAQLSSSSDYVELISDSVFVGDLIPLDTVKTLELFDVQISDTTPDGSCIPFAVTIFSTVNLGDLIKVDTVGFDTFSIRVGAPNLEHIGHKILTIGRDTFLLLVGLRNTGGGDIDSLVVKLVSSDVSTVIDSEVVYDFIPAFSAIPASEAPSFKFTDNNVEGNQFTLILSGRGYEDTLSFRYWMLDTVTNVVTTSLANAVMISWSPIYGDSILGYRVYRSTDPDSGFKLLNIEPVEMGYYIDHDLTYGPTYYYKVSVVDTCWNESQPAGLASGFPNPPQLAGWPQYIPDAGFASPLVVDFDPEHPGLEIIVPATFFGSVYAFYADGSVMPGWPVVFEEGTSVWSTPAAADLDGDGELEVVIAPRGPINQVFAFEKDGTVVEGWPKAVAGGGGSGTAGVLATPAIGDIDADGTPEVVVLTMNGKLYVWHGDGTAFGEDSTGFFVQVPGGTSWNLHSPSLADIDNDGKLEIIIGATTSPAKLYVYRYDGSVQPGFPVDLDDHAIGASIAVADFLPDVSGLEMAVATAGTMFLVTASGEIASGWPVEFPFSGYSHYVNPSAADVDGDGEVEIIINACDKIIAYDPDGQIVAGFPIQTDGGGPSSVTVGDIEGDGTVEFFRGTDACLLFGLELDGTAIPGFPVNLIEEAMATPALADVDQDGTVELVTTGYADLIWIFKLGGSFSMDNMQWPTLKHDPARTGCYTTYVAESREMSVDEKLRFELQSVLPNPFRNTAEVSFIIPKKTKVRLKIFNSVGSLVKVIDCGELAPGWHSIRVSAFDRYNRSLASGVYFLRLETDLGNLTRRVLVLR